MENALPVVSAAGLHPMPQDDGSGAPADAPDDQAAKLSDASLVARAQGGSDAAFEQIVERYRPRIYRYLLSRVQDPELADDLTQETFLDAWQCLDRLSDGSGLLRWLYRIARYNLLPEWRRRPSASIDRMLAATERMPAALHQADETPACHDRALIESVLSELGDASGLALRYALNGYTSDEVGQLLGISGETARRRISRAKQQFRRSYRAA